MVKRKVSAKMFFQDREFSNRKLMNQYTIDCLESFRTELRFVINLTADYATGGHSDKSYHYQGMAIDGNTKAPLDLFIRLAIKHGFRGIGLYIENGLIKYFHLDTRPEAPQMWLGFIGKDGIINYIYRLGV